MRRIISRKTKESIRKYILENITLADYGAEESLMTDSEKLLRTYSIFNDGKTMGSIHLATPQLSDIGGSGITPRYGYCVLP